MHKIVKINVKDIIFDPENAGNILTKACSRRIPMHPTGLCDCDGVLLIPLEDLLNERIRPIRYYFAKFPDRTEASIETEMYTRYLAEMSFIGSFRRDEELWGLYAKGIS